MVILPQHYPQHKGPQKHKNMFPAVVTNHFLSSKRKPSLHPLDLEDWTFHLLETSSHHVFTKISVFHSERQRHQHQGPHHHHSPCNRWACKKLSSQHLRSFKKVAFEWCGKMVIKGHLFCKKRGKKAHPNSHWCCNILFSPLLLDDGHTKSLVISLECGYLIGSSISKKNNMGPLLNLELMFECVRFHAYFGEGFKFGLTKTWYWKAFHSPDQNQLSLNTKFDAFMQQQAHLYPTPPCTKSMLQNEHGNSNKWNFGLKKKSWKCSLPWLTVMVRSYFSYLVVSTHLKTVSLIGMIISSNTDETKIYLKAAPSFSHSQNHPI